MECDCEVMRLALLSGLWNWGPLQKSPALLEGDALTHSMPCDVTPPRSMGASEEMRCSQQSPQWDGAGASAIRVTG